MNIVSLRFTYRQGFRSNVSLDPTLVDKEYLNTVKPINEDLERMRIRIEVEAGRCFLNSP